MVELEECYCCGTLYDPNVGSYISKRDAVVSYGVEYHTTKRHFSQECFVAHSGLSPEVALRVMPDGLPEKHAKL